MLEAPHIKPCSPKLAPTGGSIAAARAVRRAPLPKKKITKPGTSISEAIKMNPASPQTKEGLVNSSIRLLLYVLNILLSIGKKAETDSP